MVLALGTDIARILDNLSLTEVDMLEPKGCDSIVAGPVRRINAIKAPSRLSTSVSAGMAANTSRTCSSAGPIGGVVCLSDSVVLGRQIEIVGV
jgi:hypothetical protein